MILWKQNCDAAVGLVPEGTLKGVSLGDTTLGEEAGRLESGPMFCFFHRENQLRTWISL